MQHFYDGQIRRYITQIVRLMSNFSYKSGDGDLTTIPVMYGDLTRQVASIIRDNSENKIPSAPRMSVYITGLEMDNARLADSSYVNKLNIRELAYDSDGEEYLNKEGKNYTVERLMPTPYTLTVNVDIWSTNTDQKLQILEQILMLFNPSLEIQTTDNYIDWTSLSVVNLENVQFSSRSIPVGTESEIDIAQLTLKTPIYLSPPVKVKRLGVITTIIQSIFNETEGTIEVDLSRPVSQAWQDNLQKNNIVTRLDVSDTGSIEYAKTHNESFKADVDVVVTTSHDNYNLLIMDSKAKLVRNGVVDSETWTGYLKGTPEEFRSGITQIKLKRADYDTEITGTVAINTSNEYELIVNWDSDTLPTDTIINSSIGDRNKIDYIIDPYKTNPTSFKSGNPRILILADINPSVNVGQDVGETPDNYVYDGADAWKNADGTDFVAGENDIVEWDGSNWSVIFDASEYTSNNTLYTTNLNTGIQYKYYDNEWLLSFEGEYQNGTWRLLY